MHWAIFAGLGPLIGCISALVGTVLVNAVRGDDPFPGLSIIEVFIFCLPLAYLFGLIPSLAAAAAVQQVQIRKAKYEWFLVSLIGTAIGFGFELSLAKLIALLVGTWQGGVNSYFTLDALLVFVPTCLVPTLLCWLLSKWLVKESKRPFPAL